MKKIITALILLLLLVQVGQAQCQPYHPGEKASYIIKYGPITGGVATLKISEDTRENQKVLHAVITGQTTGVADALYRVRDTYESFIDPRNDLPVFSIRNISEGKYKKYNEVSFDHHSRRDSAILMSNLSGKHIAPKGILDILSCFYWFRKYDLCGASSLRYGQTFTVTTWFADELYPIILKYKGIDNVKVKGGKIRCYRFNPVTEIGRLFKTNDDMSIWFSADENFLPVKIRFDIFVGSFNVELVNYEGLSKPLKIN